MSHRPAPGVSFVPIEGFGGRDGVGIYGEYLGSKGGGGRKFGFVTITGV